MMSSCAIYLLANVHTLFYARCVLVRVFLRNGAQRDLGVKNEKEPNRQIRFADLALTTTLIKMSRSYSSFCKIGWCGHFVESVDDKINRRTDLTTTTE